MKIISIIFLIIFFILFINFMIMNIYSIFARKLFINKIKNKKQNTNINKTYRINIFKLYLSGLVRYELRLIGNIPSHRIRNFVYKKVFLMKIGTNSIIYGGAEIRSPWNIKIGSNTIIGDESKLDGRNGLIIQNNVNFSTGVWIWTDQHVVNSENFDTLPIGTGKVIIKNYCWCGPRTLILPGKIMEKGSVLAAGGVLTKNTEEFGIYAGIPARKISDRNRNLQYTLSETYLPFY